MARCYCVVRYETLRTRMTGALGAILEKKKDMIGAVSCAEGAETWLKKLGAAAAECRAVRASIDAGGR
eukprot:603654-Pyramimonas_sp.AAC.1